mmetsp:Transcript_64373/g.76223  ORF Transcript_64373/g.76223 Transcript_64373/m.76223 type:complete len:226 (+) Transcript_64373:259-936(+)
MGRLRRWLCHVCTHVKRVRFNGISLRRRVMITGSSSVHDGRSSIRHLGGVHCGIHHPHCMCRVQRRIFAVGHGGLAVSHVRRSSVIQHCDFGLHSRGVRRGGRFILDKGGSRVWIIGWRWMTGENIITCGGKNKVWEVRRRTQGGGSCRVILRVRRGRHHHYIVVFVRHYYVVIVFVGRSGSIQRRGFVISKSGRNGSGVHRAHVVCRIHCGGRCVVSRRSGGKN